MVVAGLLVSLLSLPLQDQGGGGWLLIVGWFLVWLGMARTISGSRLTRYGGGFLSACGALVAITAFGGFSPGSTTASGRFVMPQSVGLAAPVVTRAEFDRLDSGMSYTQAVKIIGASGDLLSSSDLAGIRTVMYAWTNSNGSNMNALFQDDRLVQKAQFGLP